jgi:hypothetical protein
MEEEITDLYVQYNYLKLELDIVSKKINKIHRNCAHGDSVCEIIRENGYYNCTSCDKKIPILGKEIN